MHLCIHLFWYVSGRVWAFMHVRESLGLSRLMSVSVMPFFVCVCVDWISSCGCVSFCAHFFPLMSYSVTHNTLIRLTQINPNTVITSKCVWLSVCAQSSCFQSVFKFFWDTAGGVQLSCAHTAFGKITPSPEKQKNPLPALAFSLRHTNMHQYISSR